MIERRKLMLSEDTERLGVYVCKLRTDKGRYVVTEGDPRDRSWRNWLGGQKLLPGNKLHEMHRSFSADEITQLWVREIKVLGPCDEPVSPYWEGYRPLADMSA